MAADRIDAHAHYLPEGYRGVLAQADQLRPDGITGLPDWDPESALAAMNHLGVKTAVLSISSTGVHVGNAAQAIELARLVNEDSARIVTDNPDRFGLFASLPLPEVDAAVAEAKYALDHLNADGVVLMTNHCDIYLGDEQLRPLYAERNARSAVAFMQARCSALPHQPSAASAYLN
ncbi:hypothetical protein A5692_21860 [Mycobacterium sp. E342]|uniref:amidohydrolase family protein n=1 Tax=Mycobacterium sp. E342 TaxID=1834147 RepID=UPI0007FE4880|nr:amidohydrolase family protein [Mycobacterium sp. E342]OBH29001.1 hypothetical protein A5692_21860 [Mycobacterium sp. E342]